MDAGRSEPQRRMGRIGHMGQTRAGYARLLACPYARRILGLYGVKLEYAFGTCIIKRIIIRAGGLRALACLSLCPANCGLCPVCVECVA